MIFTLNGSIDPSNLDYQWPSLQDMINIVQQGMLQHRGIRINIKLNMEDENVEIAKLQFAYLRFTGQI